MVSKKDSIDDDMVYDTLLEVMNEKVVCREKEILGDKWHIVSFNDFNTSTYPPYHEMQQWCEQTFGSELSWSWSEIDSAKRWFVVAQKYYFANEEDRTLFLLRWG